MMTQLILVSALLCWRLNGVINHKEHAERSDVVQEMEPQTRFQEELSLNTLLKNLNKDAQVTKGEQGPKV